MAADASWPSIERHGLLSTAALVDRWDIQAAGVRASILAQRRANSIAIEHPEHGVAVVRDHKPIHSASLAAALVDMTPEQWFEVLNERVFFFLQRHRLESMLGAYSESPQLVITVDTASLVAEHEAHIELCRINSGFAQPHNHVPRNRQSFLPISEYPHRDRAAANPRGIDVAELTVLGGVPDIAAHVIRVERVSNGQVIEQLL